MPAAKVTKADAIHENHKAKDPFPATNSSTLFQEEQSMNTDLEQSGERRRKKQTNKQEQERSTARSLDNRPYLYIDWRS